MEDTPISRPSSHSLFSFISVALTFVTIHLAPKSSIFLSPRTLSLLLSSLLQQTCPSACNCILVNGITIHPKSGLSFVSSVTAHSSEKHLKNPTFLKKSFFPHTHSVASLSPRYYSQTESCSSLLTAFIASWVYPL